MPKEQPTQPSKTAIDFARNQSPPNPQPSSSPFLWQKAIAVLVVIIIAVSGIAVFLLAQRLIDAQDRFARAQTAIVNQLITKIDDLQSLSEGQLKTLKDSQHKELEAFKKLQEAKLQDLQSAQNALLEDLKKNRDTQLKLLKEQVKHLPGAPKPDDDDD
jgi:biopolymer transport protein ExbB/TolQ